MTLGRAIILMGPSGCGKSTLGKALSQDTGWRFIEGDDFHPDANIEKMRSGDALDDSDRSEWLNALVGYANALPDKTVVIACSALTHYVQSRLCDESTRRCSFVLLDVSREKLADRMNKRRNHFMPPDLLDSQLDALDVPEDAIRIDAMRAVPRIVDSIKTALDKQ